MNELRVTKVVSWSDVVPPVCQCLASMVQGDCPEYYECPSQKVNTFHKYYLNSLQSILLIHFDYVSFKIFHNEALMILCLGILPGTIMCLLRGCRPSCFGSCSSFQCPPSMPSSCPVLERSLKQLERLSKASSERHAADDLGKAFLSKDSSTPTRSLTDAVLCDTYNIYIYCFDIL